MVIKDNTKEVAALQPLQKLESERESTLDDTNLQVKRLDVNQFATKKTIAQGMLDLALLTVNASQLKSILEVGRENHQFYDFIVSLIAISMCLQITVGVCFLFIGSFNLNKAKSHNTIDILNNLITVQIFLITVINIVISVFGIEHKIDASKRNKTVCD